MTSVLPCFLIRFLWCFTLLLTVIFSCSDVPEETLIIESTPQGAKVYIGEQFVGNTPLALERSEELFTKTNGRKPLKINVVLEGFHEYQTTLTSINYYQITLLPYERNLTMHFTPAPTHLYVDSKRITSGTIKRNTLSVTLSLALGEHEIFAYKENYPFLEHIISLSGQSPREIRLPLPTEKFQNVLSITGIPGEIEVYYQEKLLGITPMSLKNLSPSPFGLEFKKPGYENKNVIFNLAKKEYRPVIARLTPLKSQFKVRFNSIEQNSKIIIDEEFMIAETLSLTDLPSNFPSTKVDAMVTVPHKSDQIKQGRMYHYSITHPNYYSVVGYFPVMENYSSVNNKVTTDKNIDVINNTPIKVDQVPHIPSAPKLIVKKSLPDIFINVESDFHKIQLDSNRKGESFFVSTPVLEELRVYDRGFNELRRHDFSKVRKEELPRLAIGFDYLEYPAPLRLLVGNRIVGQDVIFSFDSSGNGEDMVTPVYMIPLSLNMAAIFDNGHHALKIYKLGNPSSLVKQVQAFDFFKLHSQDPRSADMLPLRFQQAVFLPSPPLQEINYNNSNALDNVNDVRLIFTDIVNQDVKEYRFNSQFLLEGFKEYSEYSHTGVEEVGYFISRYNKQPNDPGAITSYRELVLVADRANPDQATQTEIWVYDREGNFVHTFSLSSNKAVEYLYTLGSTLYVFTDKEVELYSLIP